MTALPRVALLAGIALGCVVHSARAQRTPRVADLQLVPAEIHLKVGERQPFLATAYDAAGNPIDNATFAWSSSNTDVVSVDQGGIVSGVSVGLAIVTVRTGTGSEARSAQAPVQVAAAGPATPAAPNVEQQRAVPSAASVARVTLLPVDASLRIGELRPFLATAYDAAGSAMNGATFQWSSSNPAVASIDQRGVVTGVSAGLAVINARTGEGDAARSAEAPVQVGAAAPSVLPPSAPAAPSAAPAATHPDSARHACDGGDALACTSLGVLYDRGTGVARDFGQARTLYQRGCDGGNARGCSNLGVLYEHGTGGPQDLEQARAFYQRACDRGDAPGCNDLGVLYQYGKGVTQDLAEARRLLRRGCDGGYAASCTNLGVLLGHGRRPDHRLAFALFQRGCDGGDAHGCTNLGIAYELGLGVAVDAAQARTLYQRACDRGDAEGCDGLRRLR